MSKYATYLKNFAIVIGIVLILAGFRNDADFTGNRALYFFLGVSLICIAIFDTLRNMLISFTFLGAGSTIFAKNVLGDIMLTEAIQKCEIALYDIDGERLEESFIVIDALNKKINASRAVVKKEHRNSAVLMLLLRFIAQFMRRENYRFL